MAGDWKVAVLASHAPELDELRSGSIMVDRVEDGAANTLKPPLPEDLDLVPLMSPDLRGGTVNNRGPGGCSGFRGVIKEGMWVFFFWERRRRLSGRGLRGGGDLWTTVGWRPSVR